jgi:hypothetical protein
MAPAVTVRPEALVADATLNAEAVAWMAPAVTVSPLAIDTDAHVDAAQLSALDVAEIAPDVIVSPAESVAEAALRAADGVHDVPPKAPKLSLSRLIVFLSVAFNRIGATTAIGC